MAYIDIDKSQDTLHQTPTIGEGVWATAHMALVPAGVNTRTPGKDHRRNAITVAAPSLVT